ncbi:hypothetical protein F3087_04785 [Nocardia colli]|uniref:Uncharacterized protein n=1 Tax=Nocardia colli TaxID=2545717 RepID=A0A5N0ENX1_9NOCA|nr:hypothetical protein [Nocardia colli]KAA8890586.1 hypothetical protein F3087_04785 [Nocardia colli]
MEHYFSISEDTPHPHSSIVVSIEIASPISVHIAQTLFEDSAEMRRWIDQFPTMEPAPPPRPGIPCAECGGGASVSCSRKPCGARHPVPTVEYMQEHRCPGELPRLRSALGRSRSAGQWNELMDNRYAVKAG